MRSLEVARSGLGQYDLKVTIVADDFGSFLLRIGELEEARQQFEASYSLRRALVSPRHLYIGNSLMYLADIRYATGDYEGA